MTLPTPSVIPTKRFEPSVALFGCDNSTGCVAVWSRADIFSQEGTVTIGASNDHRSLT
jgi:hypothetical protein